MKMSTRLNHQLNLRAEPYIYEGIYTLTIDIIIVSLILTVFYYVQILKFGIFVSVALIFLEFVSNYRIAFLCILDKIHKKTYAVNGIVLELKGELSFSSRFGSAISEKFNKDKHFDKSKIIVIDSDGNKQWFRLVTSIRNGFEITELIKSKDIACINFVVSSHANILLECNVEYKGDVRKSDKKEIDNCIQRLNKINYYLVNVISLQKSIVSFDFNVKIFANRIHLFLQQG